MSARGWRDFFSLFLCSVGGQMFFKRRLFGSLTLAGQVVMMRLQGLKSSSWNKASKMLSPQILRANDVGWFVREP